jgi:hypothetical protein
LKADWLKYAHQHATLAGWYAPSFKKALENMQEAAYTMYSTFGEDVIEMGFALVVWKKPGKNVGPDWSFMLVFRTLTFLDSQFTKVCIFLECSYIL